MLCYRLPLFLGTAVSICPAVLFITHLHGLTAGSAIHQSVEDVIVRAGISLHDRRPAVNQFLHTVPVLLADDGFMAVLYDLTLLTGMMLYVLERIAF